jgi:hypothetical protein
MEITKYQWVKGDHIGNVENVTDYGNEWVTFDSGRRIASTLLNEFMIPIQWDDQIMDFSSQTVIPKKSQKINNKEEPKKQERSFIYDLIENIKVKEDHKVNFELEFNLPKKEMINVLVSSYSEEEVLNALKEYVLSQIDINALHKNIKDKLSDLSDFL